MSKGFGSKTVATSLLEILGRLRGRFHLHQDSVASVAGISSPDAHEDNQHYEADGADNKQRDQHESPHTYSKKRSG